MEQELLRFELEGKPIQISFESFYYSVLTAGSLFHGSAFPYEIPFPLDWGKNREDLYSFIEERLEELLTDELHGSGWDGDWSVDRTDEGFVATIDYHFMNEAGYYDGWVTFTITTDKDLNVIKLENDASEEARAEYLWDDYHEGAIYQAFEAVTQRLVKDKLLLKYRAAPE